MKFVDRELTEKEMAWAKEFQKICNKMPKTIMLFAGTGGLVICDSKMYDNYDKLDSFQGIHHIHVKADGGDPWK